MSDRAESVVVRPSTDADVPAMLAIYCYHVEHGLGEYEREPLHAENRHYPDAARARPRHHDAAGAIAARLSVAAADPDRNASRRFDKRIDDQPRSLLAALLPGFICGRRR